MEWMVSVSLPRATPKSQRVSATAIDSLIDAFESDKYDIHSLMIVRHGAVVAERWWRPYSEDRKHMLFSLSKSFTSSAAGFAIDEGLLTLEDKVIEFFPDRLPAEISENLASMRVRDLLSMATGHVEEPPVYYEDDWAKAFLAQPVVHTPGTHFLYNTAATYMVAAILAKVTSQDLVDFLKPRLFDPLGIDGETWERSPQGIRTGGFGLSIRTEDIAKFGVLYAQKGVWEGKRLLSEKWIAEATSKHVSNGDDPTNDWNQGYGFQFWLCQHGLYRGDGAFGQYCIVFPDHDAVVAITSGVSDMQGVLNLIWKHLLPGLDATDDSELAERPRLSLNGPQATVAPALLSRRSYRFDDNDLGLASLDVESDGEQVLLRLDKDRIVAHLDDWIVEGSAGFKSALPTRYGEKASTPYAAKAAWTAPNELTIRLAYVETPFAPWIILNLTEQECKFQLKGPVSLFDTADRPPIVGERE